MNKAERRAPDIFLCHSKKDITFVRRLTGDLQALHVYAWFDEWEIGPGDSLHDSIARALEQSAHIGVVLSPDSVKSKWVRKELNQALSREDRSGQTLVIPMRVRGATMPSFLEDKVYLDFEAHYESALARLTAHINNLDQQRVMKRLAESPPATLGEVQNVLRFAGWLDAIPLGSQDWDRLTELLFRHSVEVRGSYLSLYDPVSKRSTDVS